MGRKRKLRHWAIGLLVAAVVAVVAVDLYLETMGFPEPLRRRVLAAAVPDGVELTVGRLRGGILNGLVVEDLTVRDGRLQDVTLLRVPWLHVEADRPALLRGRLRNPRAEWRGATLSIPLAEDAPHWLFLRRCHGRLSTTADTIRLDDLGGDFERLRLRGRLTLPGNRSAGGLPPWLDDGGVLSVRPLLPRLAGTPLRVLTGIVALAASPGTEAWGNAEFSGAVGAAGRPVGDLSLRLPAARWHDLHLRSLVLDAVLTEDTATVRDLRLELDRAQWLRANAIVDLKALTLTADVASSCFPRPLVHSVSPGLLDQEWMPVFNATPPYVEARLDKVDLRQPKTWVVDADFDIREAMFRQVEMAAWRGHLRLAWPDVHVTGLYGRLRNPAAELNGGFEWIGKTNSLHIAGKVAGNPRVVAGFCRTEAARKNYLEVWEDFAWDEGLSPKFELDATLTVVPGGEDKVAISGHADWPGTRWRDVLVDHASGDISWDSVQNRLDIRNFILARHGHRATADLAVSWGSGANIQFSLDSGLELRVLAGLIEPEWLAFLDQHEVYAGGERVQAKGRYRWHPTPVLDIDGSVAVDDLWAADLTFRGAKTDFQWHDGKLTIAPTCTQLRTGSWLVRDIAVTNLVYDGKTVTANGTVGGLVGDELEAADLTFDKLTREPDGTLTGAGVCRTIGWRRATAEDIAIAKARVAPDGSLAIEGSCGSAAGVGWKLEKLDLPTLTRDAMGRIQARAVAATAIYNDATAHKATLAGTVAGNTVAATLVAGQLTWKDYAGRQLSVTVHSDDLGKTGTADVQIGSLEAPGKYGLAKIAGNVRLAADGTRSFRGTVATVTGNVDKVGVESLEITGGQLDGDHYDVAWTAAKAHFRDTLRLQQVGGTVTGKIGGSATCRLEIGGLAGQQGLAAANVEGEITRGGNRWAFNLRAPAVKHDVFSLDQPTVVGDIANDSAIFDLAAAGFTVENLPFRQVKARVQANARDLWVRDLAATLFDGQVAGSFAYDFHQGTGNTRCQAKAVKMPALLAALRGANGDTPEVEGLLDAECQLTFGRAPTEGKPLQLNGVGHARLYEGNLWQVPIVGEFFNVIGKVLSLGTFSRGHVGRISQAETDFLLAGDRARIVDLRTNGDVVAIAAQGHYWWRTRGIDLRVRPIFLEVGLVDRVKDFVFKILPNPLAPLLNYRIVGTLEKHEWRPLESVAELLRERAEPADPAAKK